MKCIKLDAGFDFPASLSQCFFVCTTSNYIYDGLDRLTQATATLQTSTTTNQTVSNYSYNSTGNILSSPAGTYAYNGNQGTSYANPHAATSIGSLNLIYDKNGNLLTRSDNITHIWDYNNRLTKVTIPGILPNSTKTLIYAYRSI